MSVSRLGAAQMRLPDRDCRLDLDPDDFAARIFDGYIGLKPILIAATE